MAEGFINLFDDKGDDIWDGVDFVVGEELFDLQFIHSEGGLIGIWW